jgi:hypothetical protein
VTAAWKSKFESVFEIFLCLLSFDFIFGKSSLFGRTGFERLFSDEEYFDKDEDEDDECNDGAANFALELLVKFETGLFDEFNAGKSLILFLLF